jgi:predicted dehydrogenase
MGKYHADAVYQSKKCRLAAICDVNEALLKKCSDEYGPDVKASTDWHDMINDPDIDAICVTTPDHFHLEMTVAALRAGKHVLCEKPLALHVDECKEMIRVSEETGKLLMVGQVCRVAPGFFKAKQIVDSGAIGELYFVESEYAHDYTHLVGWRKDPDIKRHPVTGGGCHAVDLLRWIVGKDPTEVFAYGTHKLLPQVPYDDATVALMKFPGEVMGKVFVSTGCKRNYTMRTVLYGTKGTLIFDNKSPTMQFFEADEQGHGASKPTEIAIDLADHNAEAEFAAFGEAVLQDLTLKMTAEEGARTVAACLAIVESSVTGKAVQPDYTF